MPIPSTILQRVKANDPSLTEVNFPAQYPQLNTMDITQLAAALQGNTHVKLLILGGNNIGDEGSTILASALDKCHVETVDVSINNIGNIGAKALLSKPIVSLNLAGNEIGDDGLQPLSGNSALRTLIIHDNNLTNNCEKYFALNKSLEEALLDDNHLTPNVDQKIQSLIKRNISNHMAELMSALGETIKHLGSDEKLQAKNTIDSLFDHPPPRSNSLTVFS